MLNDTIDPKKELFRSLKPYQMEAVGLLSIGTFLEYFDLMLYVHMAVLLNELFFPKTDPHTAALLQAFAFCSTFIFRPLGALVFGYIGDHIGRKATVIITTAMMAISCIIMANLPTYSQIGITASWLITICRIFQGISSVGEIVGAKLYLTETIKPPIQYPMVSCISIASLTGTVAALGISTAVLSIGLEWRIAFWIGASIAIIGAAARTALRETPEFANAKRLIKKEAEQSTLNEQHYYDLKNNFNNKVNNKTILAYFLLHCTQPVCFYFIYIYCGNILKNSFSYTAGQIITHNLIISTISCLWSIFISCLSYKIYPLKIAKLITITFSIFILWLPWSLDNAKLPLHLFLIQSAIVLFGTCTIPATSIFYKHFPVFKRFTYSSLIYAIAHSLMYVVTSFGLIYLMDYWGTKGLLIIMLPIIIGYVWGLNHFENLEREIGNYPQKNFYGCSLNIN